MTLRSVTVSLPVLDLLFLILLMAIVFFGSLVWFGEHGNMSGLLYEWLLKTDYTCDVNVYQSQQTGEGMSGGGSGGGVEGGSGGGFNGGSGSESATLLSLPPHLLPTSPPPLSPTPRLVHLPRLLRPGPRLHLRH